MDIESEIRALRREVKEIKKLLIKVIAPEQKEEWVRIKKLKAETGLTARQIEHKRRTMVSDIPNI